MFCYPLGRDRQLFVDDMIVARAQGLTRILHQPEKFEGNPVLAGDHPVEDGFACLHGLVLYDDETGLFKAWYLTRSGIAHAFSDDGIHWRKPELDIFCQGGATPIVYRGVHPEALGPDAWKIDGCAVMLDPGAEAGSRYKMFSFQAHMDPKERERDPDNTYGYFCATSPDGIHWAGPQTPAINRNDDPWMSDACSCAYDSRRQRFIAFTKRHQMCPNGIGDQDVMLRVRGIAFSRDWEHWTTPVNCLLPDDHDPRDVNLYRMNGYLYEGMYLGELEIYYSAHDQGDKPAMRDIQLVSSRDGELWWRAGGRQTFIPCGPQGSWDGKMLDINSGGPVLVDDTLWFYYGGRSYPHSTHPRFFPWNGDRTAGIGLAKLRRDGFVSYDAGNAPGTLLTKPISFDEASRLHLNVEAPRGELRVEVLTVDEDPDVPNKDKVWRHQHGAPVLNRTLDHCIPVTGDHLDTVVAWADGVDMARFANQWIALRFELRQARLYSFWFD